MMHRTRHFWTLCVWRTRLGTPRRATFVFTPHFWLAIQNIGVWWAYLHGHLYPRNCSYPIARTMCSSGRQASLMERFSWGSTISGSVSCFSFFQSIRWPTRDWKRTNVHMFHCWRNTKVTGDQVIFCIFCILYIYCIFLLWFFFIVVQLGWMRASPPSYTSAVSQSKSCMWFQCPPYWEGCLLFLLAIQGRYRTRCEGKQPTLQTLLSTKERTAKTAAGGGTWTAGPSAGVQSNDGMRIVKFRK